MFYRITKIKESMKNYLLSNIYYGAESPSRARNKECSIHFLKKGRHCLFCTDDGNIIAEICIRFKMKKKLLFAVRFLFFY